MKRSEIERKVKEKIVHKAAPIAHLEKLLAVKGVKCRIYGGNNSFPETKKKYGWTWLHLKWWFFSSGSFSNEAPLFQPQTLEDVEPGQHINLFHISPFHLEATLLCLNCPLLLRSHSIQSHPLKNLNVVVWGKNTTNAAGGKVSFESLCSS